MGTRQALMRLYLHSWEQQEEKLIASFSKVMKQLGGYILDVALVLQVAAGIIVIITGDVPPLRNTAYQLYEHMWRYVVQEQAFALLLLFSLITGIWGLAKREVPRRLMRTATRFAVWFAKIGASVGLK